ncbi:alpha-amylase family glycosyl hydrolase [Saccharospirillum impatiens]|uniref:alpha-amylase family glycosyl hydrolase n=1 Tax=Saccharospirillum impatiens TaxID=169438 RepID=UPI0003FE9850|nr:alpha-amylase family glycosyl hydrolase [Saccharospirillum impatiens]
MPDRFANGTPANDYGDLSGDKYTHGFDPADKAFYHGGDLVGLVDKLDYLEGLGVTAIWMTPILKNKAVQGTPPNASAAHHGYWTLDFTQIDPHLGSNEELRELIDAAHERDIKIFFDIITNHTADVIKYEECHDSEGNLPDGQALCDYKSLEDLTAGNTYTPFLPTGEANAKVPDWLNDPQYYHNQGDSLFSGENSVYGDFVGLDDLATSDPAVIDGMIDIFKNIVTDFKPDGFRIDTVKHVHTEFWQAFSPAIVDHARSEGIDNFTLFGEVYSADTDLLSMYTTEGKLPSVLDFGFQAAVSATVSGGDAPTTLANLFRDDDKYSDADSDASELMTFTGNHDMGRFGHFLGEADTLENLDKMKLAHAMMYFLRGVPVIYYGDEQGFTGTGGDQASRQSMFPSQVDEYRANDNIGSAATPGDDNFDTGHPLYQAFAEYADVLRAHPALRRGVQHERYVETQGKGAFVVSRVYESEEYLVAFNTSADPVVVRLPAVARAYLGVYPERAAAKRNGDQIELELEPFGVAVYRANQPVPASPAPSVELNGVSGDVPLTGRVTLVADIDGLSDIVLPDYQASFDYSVDGGQSWHRIADDFNAPYRAYFRLNDFADGTDVQVQVTVTNSEGEMSTATQSLRVDSRYPETVTLDYPNLNQRDALYAVSNSGQFQGPLYEQRGTYALSWGPNDTQQTLTWATLNDDTGVAELDQPFSLTRSAVFAVAEEDGSGDLTAHLAIDALPELSLSGTQPDQLVEQARLIDDSIDGLNLRGGIVGWDQGSAADMNNTEYSTYHTEVFVVRGDGEFKFADDQWAAINLGGPVTENGLTWGANPANLLSFFEADSVYDVWVVGADEDASGELDYIVPIVALDAGVFAEPVFLRGTMTDWSDGRRMAHLGGDRYELVLNDLSVGNYEFKFADSDWADINLGYGDVVFSDDSVGITDPGNGNIGLSVPATNDYTLVLDATDVNNPLLSVTSSEVAPYQPQGALFVKGELNGWANLPAYRLDYLGAGQYQTTVGIDPAAFDFSGDDAGAIDFAIANAGWGFKLAGAVDTLAAGSSVTLSDAIDSNNRMDAELSPGYYDLVLDASVNANAPTLTLMANPDFTYGDRFGQPMYVRGSFNGWSNSESVQQAGVRYTDTLTLPAGEALFKLVSDDWGLQVQYADVVQNGGLALSGVDDGFGGLNIAANIPVAGDYRLTFDATNPERLMLTLAAE